MKNIKYILLLLAISYSVFAQIPANLELRPLFTTNNPRPIAARHAGDGSGRLFIAEQGGVIEIWDGTTLLPTPFLDLSAKVTSFSNGGSNEQGLLGLDFDPNFSTNGYFYVSYTTSGVNSGDSIIERYQVSSGNVNSADINSGVTLMRVQQPRSNHNGGNILFGEDGYLYIGLGDGGKQGDPDNNAQSLDRLLGKMLRIDVDPDIIFKNSLEIDNKCGLDATDYYIPENNPFAEDNNSCGEVWAYGLRNPWRWSFDKQSGGLLIGDVGQSTIEEINFVDASSTGGEHYGWNCREGNLSHPSGTCDMGDTYIEPVISHTHNGDGYCSITGGYMYQGPIVGLQGLYVYADFCQGDINFATPSTGTWSESTFTTIGFGIASFGEDESGNIYVLNHSGNTVSVFALSN
ncbi:MAG: PQQ-dependent sugar dehydrogenase [Alcanivoracaceae bacterium]|nr:PQQ-dependent sugar dehydrogenase [Alcanivoracaceae bacterium]